MEEIGELAFLAVSAVAVEDEGCRGDDEGGCQGGDGHDCGDFRFGCGNAGPGSEDLLGFLDEVRDFGWLFTDFGFVDGEGGFVGGIEDFGGREGVFAKHDSLVESGGGFGE